MTAPIETQERNDEAVEQLAGRVFEAGLASLELLTVHLGRQLGYYEALAGAPSLTSAELAATTVTDERYAREWLEQQAVAGFIAVEEVGGRRAFRLQPESAAVLLDEEDGSYMAWMAGFLRSFAETLPQVAEAYRTGAGVPYAQFGNDMIEAQAAQNRPAFTHTLVQEWLPGIPGVIERLRAQPPARVADVACGVGWSSLAFARHFPQVTVDAIDLDTSSIEKANGKLAGDTFDGQLRFIEGDAASALTGEYDIVTIFEALHDMPRPVEVLSAIRAHLREDGMLIIMDENVAESFAAPGDERERIFYAYSVLHCLPAGRAEQPSVATGTVMRPATLTAYAADAGFRSCDIAPVDAGDFRFYVLRP